MTAVQRHRLWMCMELLFGASSTLCFCVDCADDPFDEDIPEEGKDILVTVREDLWRVLQLIEQTPEMIVVERLAPDIRDWLRTLDYNIFFLPMSEVREMWRDIDPYYYKIKTILARAKEGVAA